MHAPQMAMGTPSAMPIAPPSSPMNGTGPSNPGNQGQGRTLIGATAPPGLAGYSQAYPPPPYGQYPGQPPGAQPPMPGYQNSPYPQLQHNPYAAPNPYMNAVPAVEQAAPVEGKKKSSIARDVGIGVAIAALVLGGFLAVKFLVLDGDSTPTTAESSTPASSLATIRIALPPGLSAELFIDDKKKATVSDKQDIPGIPGGMHKVKLVGRGVAPCEKDLQLPGGKTTPLECAMVAPVAGSGDGSATPSAGSAAGIGSADGAGSAVGVGSAAGSGSAAGAGSAAGSGSASGSGTVAAGATQGSSDTRSAVATTGEHPMPDKADKMPVEDKAKLTAKVDKPADQVAMKTPDKPADKPAGQAASKPADKIASRAPDKPVEKKPVKPPVVDDDPMGKLQGGTKPGEKKSVDLKKPADKPADESAAKPLAKSLGDTKGYATISSTPPARIAIDGKDTGLSTPILGHTLPLSPGKHKVTFIVGGDKFTFSITIKAGETATVHKDLGG